MTIQELKSQIDIVELIGNYTELTGHGNRLRAKVNPIREGGDFDAYQDTQRFYDQGTCVAGDVVDFIEKVENLSKSEAVSFLQEKYLNGVDKQSNYTAPKRIYESVKKDNALLFAQVERKANAYLQAQFPKGTVNLNRLTDEKYSIVEVDGVNIIKVALVFEKLFEGYIIPTDERYAEHLFNRVIGYDPYFNCPVIIIRDERGRVGDIVRYRPHREGFTDLPKYLYTKGSQKPDSSYLFPLQAQMQLIMKDQGYCYVGEGLKNAINASMAGVPFISIEGAGNIKPELITFLKCGRMKYIVMIGAFDGDEAGESAYKKVSTEIPMDNKFSFDSDTDFAEYLKGIK